MSNIFPSPLLRTLIKEYHIEERPFIEEHENTRQVTSVRMNPFKATDMFGTAGRVPWCAEGRYLKERPSFIADPLFHAGCYYVQEASSMFLEQVLKHSATLNTPVRVLDLCGAPGGKSTLIASLITPDSLLVSNEIIKSRVGTLADNLTKWGNSNAVVSNNDPRDFKRLEAYFDIMVVDAPCSGSGMFRKAPAAIDEWSEDNVQLCSERQQRILADTFPALKENGILVYSTCSYSSEENEQIADWLCDTHDLNTIRVPFDPAWGIVETVSEKHGCFGYRFYPHKVKGEGFFITCFKKRSGTERAETPQTRPSKTDRKVLDILSPWLDQTAQQLSLLPVSEGFTAVPAILERDILFIQSKLYLKKAGTYIGKIAGKDLVPDQELAQSLIVNNSVKRLQLTQEQAIKYLRKDNLKIDTELKGWALMCYQNFGLGWAKVLPNRINNYYPKGLRILSSF